MTWEYKDFISGGIKKVNGLNGNTKLWNGVYH